MEIARDPAYLTTTPTHFLDPAHYLPRRLLDDRDGKVNIRGLFCDPGPYGRDGRQKVRESEAGGRAGRVCCHCVAGIWWPALAVSRSGPPSLGPSGHSYIEPSFADVVEHTDLGEDVQLNFLMYLYLLFFPHNVWGWFEH